MKITIIITIIVLFLFVPVDTFADQIPQWVKTNAGWWASNEINDEAFLNGIEFLVNEKIIIMSTIDSSISEKTDQIPQWVKTNAGWWASNEINDEAFLGGIEHLIKNGIINIESKSNCEKDLEKISTDERKIKEICNDFKSNKNSELIPFDVKIDYNTKGFRGDDFTDKKIQDEFRIITVGGSTMFGSGNSSDQTTIPGILEKMINYNNPDLKIQVINAGIQGASSFTELELIKNKLTDYEPDLIIVYDGWNDISADYAYSDILKNWNEMCQLSEENDFELMIFLQPISGFGNKILTEQEKINALTGEDHNGFQLIQVKTQYEYLSKKLLSIEENCEVFDIHNVFDNVSGPIYWDQGHVSDRGNFIIADKFLEIINKKSPNIFNYNDKFIEIISKYNHQVINESLFSELNIESVYSEIGFKDTSNIEDQKKGEYFKIKNEFGIENILVGKDLRDMELEKINLDGKNLTGANLSGQDLRNINFKNTIIRDANLSYTNLEGVDFSEMDIRGVDFSHANLKNSNFKDVVITKMVQVGKSEECIEIYENMQKNMPPGKKVFENENLYRIFENSCIQTITKNGVTVTSFSSADLTNAKFTGSLLYVDFSSADLTNAKFQNLDCHACIFNNAILDQVEITNSMIVHTSFNNITMKNFLITNSWFQNVLFENSNMQDGVIDSSHFYFISLFNSDLDRTIIESTMIDNATNKEALKCKNNLICVN